MTRKPEIKLVHPREANSALGLFISDTNLLLSAARHAMSFLTDKELDPAKVCEAVAPILEQAINKVARHFEVEERL